MELLTSFFGYLIPFLILLGTLVFFHELGHFLVARYFGVRVEVFSLGFGPKIFGFKKGNTYYCISLIPLGGYVKLFGDNPQQKLTEAEKKEAFLAQKIWPKSAIALGGPVMNFLIAVFVFMIIGFLGKTQVIPQIGDMKEDSFAFQQGFRSNDLVLSVNQKSVSNWGEVQKSIQKKPLKKMTFEVQRQNQKQTLNVVPQKVKNEKLMELKKFVGEIEGLSVYSQSSHIGIHDYNSLAYESGLRNFDQIVEVNSFKVSNWRDLQRVLSSLSSPVLEIKAKRQEDRIMTVQLENRSLKELGIEKTNLYLDRVKKDSPAHQAGLAKGDRLYSVGGVVLENWEDLSLAIQNNQSNSYVIEYIREGEKQSVSLQSQEISSLNQEGQFEHQYMIGVASAQYVSFPQILHIRILNPLKAIGYGFSETIRWTFITAKVLGKLITGSISHRVLGGPLSIAKVAQQSFEDSLAQFLSVMAIISVNLFLINLLPIPVLDGGHLLLFAIEGIRGRALSAQKIQMVQMAGLFLVLFFVALTLVNDVKNWNLIW